MTWIHFLFLCSFWERNQIYLGETHDFYVILQFLLFQIPVVLNAVGGILVGLITSYAGGVRKVSATELLML